MENHIDIQDVVELLQIILAQFAVVQSVKAQYCQSATGC
jgi:hypothetical protein